MILKGNLPQIIKRALAANAVLDVGGWWQPLRCATHVIDVMPYASRHADDALDPENEERFSAATWTVHDVCSAPWPFGDKQFDFVFCSHLLEDVRDPIAVCGELVRVSKSGYIETPSRAREIFSKARFFGLKSAFGSVPEIGFRHHRWFVELENDRFTFTAKDQHLLGDRSHFITRSDLGRKMTEEESGIALWFDGKFSFEEAISHDHDEPLKKFRSEALARLKGK